MNAGSFCLTALDAFDFLWGVSSPSFFFWNERFLILASKLQDLFPLMLS